jgi:hypothetical protein
MAIEVEILSELYSIMKQYIPQKDRQEAADNLISVMVDMLNDIDLQEFSSTDSILKRSIKEYTAEEPEDDEDDDW